MAEESEPLLLNKSPSPLYTSSADEDEGNNRASICLQQSSSSGREIIKNSLETSAQQIKLKKHINGPYAIAIIIGSVIGSGIFVSPKGVTQNMGSVGGSLLIWGLTGLYSLCQALCYAELGALIPKAGGDYAYIYEILGSLPAFMSMWIHITILASASCAVISRTAALYLVQALQMDCHENVITLIAIWIIVSLAAVNALSALWGTRIHTFFTICKVSALAVIIIAGIVKLAQGHTENFQDGFSKTTREPGAISLAVLDGYFAYKGWELVNAMPEEMISPSRDLPIAVWVGMLTVTGVYVLTNVAYFTVLTPGELIQSDAVALTFGDAALGPVAVIIPIAVALSCMGAVNGDFLCNSRYLFAGGRYDHVPKVLGFIHMKRFTPIPAIMALCFLALLYCVVTDLQVLQEYASLAAQMKMMIALFALFYYRWKRPDLHRPVKVNIVIAIMTTIVMAAIIVLSFYKSIWTSLVGLAIFLVGIPVYYCGRLCIKAAAANQCMDCVTKAMQKVLIVVPESQKKQRDD